MAVDYLTNINDDELIKLYEAIGDRRSEGNFEMEDGDMLVVSAISKRKLTHRTKYRMGLPKSEEWR